MNSSESNVERGQINMPNGVQGGVYIMQLQSGNSELAEGGPVTFVPWLSLPHIRPLMPLHIEEPDGKHLDSNPGDVEDKEVQKEGSFTNSNTSSTSVNNGKNEEKPYIRAKNDTSAMFDLRGRIKNCGKGFVPYKRCIAERDNQSSPSVTKEEREEQRIRLSL